MRDIIRRCRFSPYRKGMGPVFSLTLWDTGHTDSMGKSVLGYRLTGTGLGVIFEGTDFACSAYQSIDGDATVASLMSFLTLRPGDTDADYFIAYTAIQIAYADHHAEALSACVSDRFGEI